MAARPTIARPAARRAWLQGSHGLILLALLVGVGAGLGAIALPRS